MLFWIHLAWHPCPRKSKISNSLCRDYWVSKNFRTFTVNVVCNILFLIMILIKKPLESFSWVISRIEVLFQIRSCSLALSGQLKISVNHHSFSGSVLIEPFLSRWKHTTPHVVFLFLLVTRQQIRRDSLWEAFFDIYCAWHVRDFLDF